jgi:acetylornithine deacetylase/succinyl-diaminopimelate desuccinylase-like protein
MRLLILLLLAVFVSHAEPLTRPQQLARDIYRQLIEINTADSAANVTGAAKAMAERLRNAGFSDEDIHVDGVDPRFQNLVVRYHGTGTAKPILLLAHLDVVEALRSDWSLDPFHFTEKEGYFYGRGTVDDKAAAACWIANLILYKQEGYRPDRDIIVALTAGEESGGEHNGVDWLLKNHRDWIDAAMALNEGADGALRNGKHIANYVQASEKVYYSVELKATDPGGHSSMPRPDNPIYWVAAALLNISHYNFPVELNAVTRMYFERTGGLSHTPLALAMQALVKKPGDPSAIKTLSEHPFENALMRTTCVATRTGAGHADNALPQLATALVNCRLLPEDKPESVLATLRQVVNDARVQVNAVNVPRIGPTSPLPPGLLTIFEKTTNSIWPGVPVIPVMSTGATDSRALRQVGIPCYGVSGFFTDPDDDREHGRDERMLVQSFYDGQKFLYQLVKALGSS